jgi:3-oxoacyl-[acyl-carrier protein] reductase
MNFAARRALNRKTQHVADRGETKMLLDGKTAVVYGGGGAIGGAIGRALAREGAHVALVGRTRDKLERVAAAIDGKGGSCEVAELDALDGAAVTRHADAFAARRGGIDVAVTAVGIMHVQGTAFAELSLEDFEHPITSYLRVLFQTAKAVSRHMRANGGGVIMTISTPGSRLAFPGALGFSVACAGIEAFSRVLAAELGPSGVRVVCLRPDAIPEAAEAASHSVAVFAPVAEAAGVSVAELLAKGAERTMLGRFPTLDEVADTAAFLASDHAGAITASTVNLSCGSLPD